MEQEKTDAIAQPSPFSEWSTTPTVPPTVQEPIKNENDTPATTDEVKDPVIKEKDKEIEKEKPTSDKPDEPEKIPAASPHDIPERAKEEGKPTSEIKLNETSEKIFNLLKEGKEDEIFPILNQRQILKNLDKLPASEVIKLQIRNENNDYTQQEIDDIFSEKYSLPEKPEQGMETDEEFAVIENKYKEQVSRIERKIERESKSAKTELATQLQELVLPDIPQKNPQLPEPTQEELDKFKAQRENYLQAVEGSLKDLNGYNATFKDEEVEIPVAYSVSKQEKEALRPLLDSLDTDLPQFFKQLDWLDKDGKPNIQKVASDLHIILNKDAVIQKFVNEAGNKRHAETVKRQKNVDFSGQQRRGRLEPSVQEEVDKKVSTFFAAT